MLTSCGASAPCKEINPSLTAILSIVAASHYSTNTLPRCTYTPTYREPLGHTCRLVHVDSVANRQLLAPKQQYAHMTCTGADQMTVASRPAMAYTSSNTWPPNAVFMPRQQLKSRWHAPYVNAPCVPLCYQATDTKVPNCTKESCCKDGKQPGRSARPAHNHATRPLYSHELMHRPAKCSPAVCIASQSNHNLIHMAEAKCPRGKPPMP